MRWDNTRVGLKTTIAGPSEASKQAEELYIRSGRLRRRHGRGAHRLYGHSGAAGGDQRGHKYRLSHFDVWHRPFPVDRILETVVLPCFKSRKPTCVLLTSKKQIGRMLETVVLPCVETLRHSYG
jgi:hypothetical protein